MRFLHFSDVHVEDGYFLRVSPFRFLNKRGVGYANLLLRRRPMFRDAIRKMGALAEFARQEAIDVAFCTGDYTYLGTEPELALARRLVQPLADTAGGFVTVPGNHDVYLPDALPTFQKHFGDLLRTDLPELAVDGVWPQVRFFGDEVAAIALNSARPNPPVLRSSGRVPEVQLQALTAILDEPRLQNRFVFVLTHYAPRLANGRPDTRQHGLENADALLAACARIGRGALLHGHVHHCYQVRVPEMSIPISGAGSATMRGREGLWVYEVDGASASALRCHWRRGRYEVGERLPLA